MMQKHVRTTSRALAMLACGALLGGVIAGCRGERSDSPPHQFFPDLDDAPKWNPQTQSEFFTDGRTLRVPPAGTVPFGRQGFVSDADWATTFNQQRTDLLKADSVYYTGKAADGTFVVKAPIAFTKEDLLRGQERFNITCAVCHNYNGDGLGMVGAQWSYALPNFHDASGKYTNPAADQGRDGYLFQVARMGVPGGAADNPDYVNSKMPGYAHALSVDDTWRIIAYIRALQASRQGTLSDVPEAQRDVVRKMWDEQAKNAQAMPVPAPMPAPVPAPAPSTGGSK
jgi:mono/diheme cytochrome c family protein